jgi:hypothetical protein
MFGLTLIMTMLLGYQVMMPQVNNAKYTFNIDHEGTIIRMNTQNGVMERCDKNLICKEEK